MGFSESDFQAMQQRLARNNRQPLPSDAVPVTAELPLHDQIIKHCNDQFPRWKYIHANPSQRSCIAVGCQDFTVFVTDGVTVCVECKSKDGKLDPDQMIWRAEMKALGHEVYVVRSMADFLNTVAGEVAKRRDLLRGIA